MLTQTPFSFATSGTKLWAGWWKLEARSITVVWSNFWMKQNIDLRVFKHPIWIIHGMYNIMVWFSIIWLLKLLTWGDFYHLQGRSHMETQLRLRLIFVSVLPGQILDLLIFNILITTISLYIRTNGMIMIFVARFIFSWFRFRALVKEKHRDILTMRLLWETLYCFFVIIKI